MLSGVNQGTTDETVDRLVRHQHAAMTTAIEVVRLWTPGNLAGSPHGDRTAMLVGPSLPSRPTAIISHQDQATYRRDLTCKLVGPRLLGVEVALVLGQAALATSIHTYRPTLL